MPLNLYNSNTFLSAQHLLKLPRKFGCPIWVYDSNIIKKQIYKLNKFDIIRFAQKACSNTNILRFMKNKGVKIDAVSLGEIERALQAGFIPNSDDIVFTADSFNQETLIRLIELNIPINVGSIDMLHQIGKQISNKNKILIRINPGFGHGHNTKTNTGGENSKHGIWYKDIPRAINIIKLYNLNLIGIHMHIGSGADYNHLKKVCDAMVYNVLNLNHDIKIISAGGGLSIPYKFNEHNINIDNYYKLWNNAKLKISNYLKHSVTLEIEPGRFLVAESGILLSQVHAIKQIGKKYFVLLDVGFNDLMRSVLYGSYHHISVLPYDGRILSTQLKKTIIAGHLCESGDVFTQDSHGNIHTRNLPEIKLGDYIIFHDTGAYGASMSSNYNSRTLLPEVLFNNTGKSILIRRAQHINELINLENI